MVFMADKLVIHSKNPNGKMNERVKVMKNYFQFQNEVQYVKIVYWDVRVLFALDTKNREIKVCLWLVHMKMENKLLVYKGRKLYIQ